MSLQAMLDNTEHLKQRLKELLVKNEATSIAIKGKWGVGKTYFWKKFIKETDLDFSKTKRETYAYVSLFGLKDGKEIKRKIITSQRSLKDTSEEVVVDKIKKYAKSKANGLFSFLGKIIKIVTKGAIDISPLGDIVSDFFEEIALKDLIVCIDDLERKEKSITVSELLGLINYLREEKNCHVVLIYNEEKINIDSNENGISEFREKVFEYEFQFELGMEKSFELIFGANSSVDYFDGTEDVFTTQVLQKDNRNLGSIIKSSGNSNIRVMKKIKTTLDYFIDGGVKAKYPLLWPEFARDIAKSCILYYEHGDFFSLEEIFKERMLGFRSRNKEQKDERHEKQEEILEKLGGFLSSSVRMIIKQFLSEGYVDWESANRLFIEVEGLKKVENLHEQYRSIWDYYGSNFQMNADELAQHIGGFLKEHWEHIPLQNVDVSTNFIKEILEGSNDQLVSELEEVRSKKIQSYIARANLDILDSDVFWKEGLADETVQSIISGLKAREMVESMNDVFQRLTDRKGWNSKDFKKLETKSVSEFLDFFKSSKDEELIRKIRSFLERMPNTGDDKGIIELKENFEKALQEIGNSSPINKKRLKLIYRDQR